MTTNTTKLHTLDLIAYYGGDEPKPETNQNHIRIYAHNLCPFAARAKYTFSAKGIEFQECFVDLGNKAQWHKDFNGGLIPVVENQAGKMIPESTICMNLALRIAGQGQGINVVPTDPMEAAKMRYAMEQFTKKNHGGNCIGLLNSCGLNEEKVQKFQNESLPFFEEMCKTAGDKWLMGTDDLTLLDIHCGPMWEKIYVAEESGALPDLMLRLNWRETAPAWCAYVDRFREHPAIKPYRFNAPSLRAQCEKLIAAAALGQGAPLSMAVLEGNFYF